MVTHALGALTRAERATAHDAALYFSARRRWRRRRPHGTAKSVTSRAHARRLCVRMGGRADGARNNLSRVSTVAAVMRCDGKVVEMFAALWSGRLRRVGVGVGVGASAVT